MKLMGVKKTKIKTKVTKKEKKERAKTIKELEYRNQQRVNKKKEKYYHKKTIKNVRNRR
jgi:hypothetical protein